MNEGMQAVWDLVRGLIVSLAVRLSGELPKPVEMMRAEPDETLVAIVGDSLTEGWASASFVDMLARRMCGDGYRFLNAGVGGDFAYNLRQRMAAVVESRPHAIVLLIGTNDAHYEVRGGALDGSTQRQKQLPQPPTLDWYQENLRQLVSALLEQTPARIAVCSIPLLGEDLDSPPNDHVRRYNAAIKSCATKLGVAYLPVFERMEAFVRTRQSRRGRLFVGASLMPSAMWDHFVLKRGWDAISERNGFLLLTDGFHLNTRGAQIVAHVIEDWLRSVSISSNLASIISEQ
jgi:acyl-CoA thioesterase I